MDKKIETSKFSHQDEREKIIKVAKKEESSMKLYADAEEVFGTKRWEDDWRRIFIVAGPAGYIGNLVSVTLGVSGGVFLAYQLTSNWASAILIGVIVTLIMEIAKSLSLKESIIHALRGKGVSSMVLGSVAVTMLVASAYFSVESGKETPYFQRWVKAESGVVTSALPPTLSSERLSKIDAELKAIENERASYEQRNPNKTAKWLKADTYERLKAEQESIGKQLAENSEKSAAEQVANVEAKTADNLSWWFWALVFLSESCVVFGYAFRPYYLYRCRELAIAEGKSIRKETLEVDAPTHYEAVQVPKTESEAEYWKREAERLQKQVNAPTPHNTPPQGSYIRNLIGFQTPVVETKESAVYTEYAENTDANDANDVKSMYEGKLSDKADDKTLLAVFQIANARYNSYKDRTTPKAISNTQFALDKMDEVQCLLNSRGKQIVKDARNAFTIVALS